MRLTPATPWPDLEALDPFACNLIIEALLEAGPEAVAGHLKSVSDQVQIHALPRPEAGPRHKVDLGLEDRAGPLAEGSGLGPGQGVDLHLVGHGLEVTGHRFGTGLQQGFDDQVAGERIQRLQVRPRRGGRQTHGQQARNAGHHRQGVLAAEEAGAVGRVTQGGRRVPFGIGRHQGRDPGRRARGLGRRDGSGGRGRESARQAVGGLIGVGGGLAGLLHHVEPLHDLVEAGQALADQVDGHRLVARPHRRQHVLRRVQQAAHGGEFDDARGALQGVEGAEHAVHPLAVVRRLLEGQKVARALFHQLAALDQELFEELVHAAGPHSKAT